MSEKPVCGVCGGELKEDLHDGCDILYICNQCGHDYTEYKYRILEKTGTQDGVLETEFNMYLTYQASAQTRKDFKTVIKAARLQAFEDVEKILAREVITNPISKESEGYNKCIEATLETLKVLKKQGNYALDKAR